MIRMLLPRPGKMMVARMVMGKGEKKCSLYITCRKSHQGLRMDLMSSMSEKVNQGCPQTSDFRT